MCQFCIYVYFIILAPASCGFICTLLLDSIHNTPTSCICDNGQAYDTQCLSSIVFVCPVLYLSLYTLSGPVFVLVSVMCHVSYLWKPRVQFIGVVASSDWPRAEQWVCMHGSHGVQ